MPLTPELDQALFHASSIGGARPKALIQDQGKKYVAKFSSSTDLYSVVKAEFVAMRLAESAGLKTCLETAHNFLLSGEEARAIFARLTDAIQRHWDAVCAEAELNEVDKNFLWRRQFLNPYSIEQ